MRTIVKRGTSESDRCGILAGLIAQRARSVRDDPSHAFSEGKFLLTVGPPATASNMIVLKMGGGVSILASFSRGRSYRLITDLGRSDLRLDAPFQVEQGFSDGNVVLSHAPTDLFGYGRDLQEAISDFKAAAAELYERLSDNEARLGKGLVPVLEDLRRHIRRS